MQSGPPIERLCIIIGFFELCMCRYLESISPDSNDVFIHDDLANTFLHWVLSIVDSMDVFNTQPYPVVDAIQQHISISTHIFLGLLRILYPSRAPASPGFLFGGGTRPMPPGRCHPVDATRPMPSSRASVVYTFEALAGSWGSVSAPAASRIMGGAQSETKLQNI